MFTRFLGAALLAIVCCFQAHAVEPVLKIEIPDAPDKAAEAILKALAKHELQVLWQMLPPKYQSDIKQLQKEIGENKTIGAEMWKLHFETIGLAAKVAVSKKEFVLHNEHIKQMFGQDIQDQYDSIGKLIDLVFNSELNSFERIAQLDLERFLATTGTQVIDRLIELKKHGGNLSDTILQAVPIKLAEFENFKNVKVTVVKSSVDSATLRLQLADEPPHEMEWQKVEGRWVPSELTNAWPSYMKTFREQFAAGWVKVKIEEKEKIELEKVMKKIWLVQKRLHDMEQVKSQQEFDAALLKTIQQLQEEYSLETDDTMN